MKTVHALLVGANGRMGREIEALAQGPVTVSARVSSKSKLSAVKAKEVDVVIDFSSPEGLREILDWCLKNKKPLVSGTTGLDPALQKDLKEASKKIPVLWSANMSVGIAVLKKALSSLPKLEGFDVVIEEFHHNKKKDKPSGTALALKGALESSKKNKVQDVVSIRGGGIFGVHKIHCMSQEELLVFEHTALNRTVFAKGALLAADWLAKQSKGFYSMDDVLGS